MRVPVGLNRNEEKGGAMAKKSRKMIPGLILLVSCLTAFLINVTVSKAASCNIMIETETNEIAQGENFGITIKVKADEIISNVEMRLEYDENTLEFITASPQVTGEDGYLKINDLDITEARAEITYKVQFKMKGTKTSSIKVIGTPDIYNESSSQTMSAACNILRVTGVANKNDSSDNYLKSLKISGGKMAPEFSSKVKEYSVEVEPGVTKLILSAKPSDPEASVQVDGANELEVGKNTVSIIVTAPNGDTREYMLYAYVDENSDETKGPKKEPTEESEQEPTKDDSSSKVEDINKEVDAEKDEDAQKDGVVVTTASHDYIIETLNNKSLLPEGYEETCAAMGNVVFTAYEKKGVASDFVLVYASCDGTKPALYQYDKIENTFQRFNESSTFQTSDGINPTQETSTTHRNNTPIKDYLLIGLLILCILFTGTTFIFYQKSRK